MKSNKKTRKSKLINKKYTLTERLKREKMIKKGKSAARKFDISKERDSLIQDMAEYQRYATGRIINLSMLKNMINNRDKTQEDIDTLTQIDELLGKFQSNIKEVQTSMDICKRLNNKLDISAAMEATANLSSELVEVLMEAETFEERVTAVIEPYREELKAYMVQSFSKPMTAKQADDAFDVDTYADEEVLKDKEVSDGGEAEENKEAEESSRV